MSALIMLITKDNESIPWKFTEDFNLSEEETSKYVTAYIEYKKTLPGYRATTTKYVDNLTKEVVLEFDTKENAKNAQALLYTPEPGTLPYEVINFFTNKYNDLGIAYTRRSFII